MRHLQEFEGAVIHLPSGRLSHVILW